MSLVTRCPRCKTLFRVQPVQLQSRAGQVRCGRCMNVFDGFQALAVEQANTVSEPVRFEPEHTPDEVMTPAAAPREAAAATSAEAVAATPAEAVAATPVTAVETPVAAVTDTPAPVEAPAVPAIPLGTRMNDIWTTRVSAPLGERLKRKASPRTKWAAACALLLAALGIQMAYAFRSDLVARYPSFKSTVASICEVTGCS